MNTEKHTNKIFLLALIIISAVALVGVSYYIYDNNSRKHEAQVKQNLFDKCIAEADLWYAQNSSVLPNVCRQNNYSENDCNDLLKATITGRDKRRDECVINYK